MAAMTRITKPLRSRAPVKRIDLTDMRSLFKDRRLWSAVGIVTAPEGEEHWQVVTNEDGDSVDVTVEVVLQPSEEPITCRLPAGVWDVPDVGDEVGVILPEGERDFMPMIVCRLSTNVVPTTQGPQPGRIVLVRDEVLVHDGDGGAVPLALKSDVQEAIDKLNALITAYKAHLHSGGVLSGALTGVPTVVTVEDSNDATGTEVLLGK